MFAFGTRRTSRRAQSMSAFGGKADVRRHVEPIASMRVAQPSEVGFPLIALTRALQVMRPVASAISCARVRVLRSWSLTGSIAAIVWLTVAASELVVQ